MDGIVQLIQNERTVSISCNSLPLSFSFRFIPEKMYLSTFFLILCIVKWLQSIVVVMMMMMMMMMMIMSRSVMFACSYS